MTAYWLQALAEKMGWDHNTRVAERAVSVHEDYWPAHSPTVAVILMRWLRLRSAASAGPSQPSWPLLC